MNIRRAILGGTKSGRDEGVGGEAPLLLGPQDRAYPVQESAIIDPRMILAAVLRNRWPVAGIIILAVVVGMLSVLLASPIYRATASVQIDQQIAKVLGTEDADQYQITGDAERFLQTQIDVLQSRDLAEQVVDKLGLATDRAYAEAFGIAPDDKAPEDTKARRDRAIAALQGALDVTLRRMSRIAQVQVESRDAAMSARVANAYVETYITSNLQRRFDQSSYSRKFLQDQLNQTRIKLENSERVMVDFARAAGLIEIAPLAASSSGESGGQSLATSDLVQLNQAFTDSRAARIAAEQRWLQAQATPPLSLAEVRSDPAVQTLLQELSKARVEYRHLRERLKDGHPTVEQKLAAVNALEVELGSQASSVRNSIRDRYLVAARQEGRLAATVSGLKGATLSERDHSIRYNILRREVETNRELYNGLLQRYKEVSAEAGVTTNNITIIDVAVPPKAPSSPRPALNMALALLLGLGGAGAWVFGREHLTDAVRTPEDVQARVGLALMGVMPKVRSGTTPLVELHDPKSQFSEAVHAMRATLELATSNGVPHNLALTSARPSEGKSTLAASLGREFAAAGKRVMLIDADMRKPSVHSAFDLKNTVGLSQILARQTLLGDAIMRSGFDGLDVLVSGKIPPDPTLLLDGNRLSDVLDSLSSQYDLIILDCPPVLGIADALQVAAKVEATIMVIEANDTRFTNLKTALNRLRDSRINLIGAVLSKFDAAQFGYSEYYGYYYSHYGSEK
jgi:capsular exopolysaccharide synthesis family protein